MTARLVSLDTLPPRIARPGYDRNALSPGIVHIGVGAFHKAHQAVYTDDALAHSPDDWLITGVSLRSPDVADALNPQNGLYTLLVRGPDGVHPRVIGAIHEVLVAPREQAAVLAALTRAETRIVSLTITEKGYGLDPKTGGLDRAHPAIAADLADPDSCTSALGYIVAALHVRMAFGLPAFTVLCCDNLPSNGRLLRRLTLEFAAARDPEVVSFIENEVSFPSTMVDRITPASTEETFAEAQRLTGHLDLAAVETEPFSQWIIEDDFVAERPAWEAGGALFVEDVAPYEKMKLRMLNGSHSLLAYAGYLAGHQYVRDAMRDADLVAVVARHMRDAALTLDPVPGIDLGDYAAELRKRFSNPAIAHQTYQIAMDGTQKLPQRLLEPAVEAMEHGHAIDSYAFAVAAWMRYAIGRDEGGTAYALRDPREAEIASIAARSGGDPERLCGGLHDLPGLFPGKLVDAPQWREAVTVRLRVMLEKGMRAAIAEEAGRRTE